MVTLSPTLRGTKLSRWMGAEIFQADFPNTIKWLRYTPAAARIRSTEFAVGTSRFRVEAAALAYSHDEMPAAAEDAVRSQTLAGFCIALLHALLLFPKSLPGARTLL